MLNHRLQALDPVHELEQGVTTWLWYGVYPKGPPEKIDMRLWDPKWLNIESQESLLLRQIFDHLRGVRGK
jgi:hypothetical protein